MSCMVGIHAESVSTRSSLLNEGLTPWRYQRPRPAAHTYRVIGGRKGWVKLLEGRMLLMLLVNQGLQ